jgi:O-6-methylguanine DNA methyltransferase
MTNRLIATPLGPMMAKANASGLTSLVFLDELQPQPGQPQQRTLPQPDPLEHEATGHLAALDRQLAAYFRGELRAFDLPLAVTGTPYQIRVWQALQCIPFGSSLSYTELARMVDGRPSASRAVGLANGANPIAIVIPCHRVLRTGGGIGGYAAGVWRKQRLLAHEGLGLFV